MSAAGAMSNSTERTDYCFSGKHLFESTSHQSMACNSLIHHVYLAGWTFPANSTISLTPDGVLHGFSSQTRLKLRLAWRHLSHSTIQAENYRQKNRPQPERHCSKKDLSSKRTFKSLLAFLICRAITWTITVCHPHGSITALNQLPKLGRSTQSTCFLPGCLPAAAPNHLHRQRTPCWERR